MTHTPGPPGESGFSSVRRAFDGFPNSGRATAVPNLFFSQVLPAIDRSEELVVTAYFFFAAQLIRRRPPFLTRRELEADSTLARALANLGGEGDGLIRGLALAAERGSLFRATVHASEREEELYVVNTAANRRALGALAERGVEIAEPLPRAEGIAPPNIFSLYEENIGGITPLIADDLKDAEERYPAEWLREAFREAAELNKRNWRYIERILRRWETEGPGYEKAGRDPQIEWLERRYRQAGKRWRATPAARR